MSKNVSQSTPLEAECPAASRGNENIDWLLANTGLNALCELLTGSNCVKDTRIVLNNPFHFKFSHENAHLRHRQFEHFREFVP